MPANQSDYAESVEHDTYVISRYMGPRVDGYEPGRVSRRTRLGRRSERVKRHPEAVLDCRDLGGWTPVRMPGCWRTAPLAVHAS